MVGDRDGDRDRLDDVLNERLALAAGDAELAQESTELQVILKTPVEQAQLDGFVADGGKVRYVFRELSYGWTGTLPLARLPALAARLGEPLHFVAAPRQVVPFLDEATRTGRVRNVWAAGFAGQVAGFSGNANITIAVIDTGVDGTHPDLASRMQGWVDYSPDAFKSTRDVEGHGTHVASIALGSGAAFAAAGGALKFTQNGDLTGAPSGSFLAAPVHTPTYLSPGSALVASASASFLGGGSATLHRLRSADGVSPPMSFGNANGASPVALGSLDSGTNGMLYQAGLAQAASGALSNFAVSNTITGYPGVGDGLATLRGVAPSCKWFGAKVFTDAGLGNTFFIEEALDDVVARRSSDNIKIANLSLGVQGGGVDTVIRAKVNTTVDAGVLVVVAAGNDGPLTAMGDPGRASKVITVGAANDLNELTTYTSIGPASPGADEDVKPDLVAPGGSSYRSGILAADSNTADGDLTSFPDVVANDYANLQGTSMATPFVSGALALMIDALQQSGTSWSFGSSAQPLFLKMLLSASATELNQAREQGEENSPSLGRAAAPKDRFEGHGILNPDAAIEALMQTFVSPLDGSVSNVAPARLEWERRAWGRKLGLVNGEKVLLNLAVPSTADFDVYLYAGTGNAKGNPIIRASSTTAGLGSDELISFTSSATETAYVFVKRISGHGSFSLTGSAVSHCNDGKLDTGELCDPGIAGTACCTATCSFVDNGTSCDDGNKCTNADSCQTGVCGGSAVVCPTPDQCHTAGSCDTSTGVCSNPAKADGATCNDGSKCTQTDTCVSGACQGANPVVCAALDQCHTAGTCNTGTGLCSNPAKANGVSCDDGSKCTQTDTCQSGSCSGKNPVVCAALDQCHAVGSCDSATGVCSNPNKTEGASCNDGSLCTQTDKCVAGECTGTSPVVCPAPAVCHELGSCQSASGKCDYAQLPNGSACGVKGACQGGSCIEPPPTGEGGAGGEGGVPSAAGSATGGAGGVSGGGGGGEPLAGSAMGGAAAGTATGGTATGGTATGGTATGGTATGGTATGGAATSGASSGGTSLSGAPAGGADAGSSSAGTSSAGTSSLAGSANGAAAGAPDSEVAGTAGVTPTDDTSHNSSGCGCELPGRRERGGWSALGLLAALGVLSRARRQRRMHA